MGFSLETAGFTGDIFAGSPFDRDNGSAAGTFAIVPGPATAALLARAKNHAQTSGVTGWMANLKSVLPPSKPGARPKGATDPCGVESRDQYRGFSERYNPYMMSCPHGLCRRLVIAAALGVAVCLTGTPGAGAQQIIRLGGGGAGAQASGDSPHTRASLVARADAAPRGGVVEIGLRLQLDPEWHVYWLNPGDAGLPPKLKWTLPDGVSVSDIDWPAPHYHRDDHGLITYLYEGDVVLPLTLTVDENFLSDRVNLVADVSWLVCREACLSGKAKLTLDLPVVDRGANAGPAADRAKPSGPSKPAIENLFAAADARSPQYLGPEAVRRLNEVPGRFGFAIEADLVNALEMGEVTARIMPVESGLLDEAAPHSAVWSEDGALHVTAPRADETPAPADARGFIELHGGEQTLIFRFGPPG